MREEQFRTQIPKLRLLTSVPLAPGEEWGQRWEFNTLVESRDIDFARATLPNVGGITEMLKIMAMCDTHKVGIVPHLTGPVSTAAQFHTMTSFPGQVVMEYNYGATPPPHVSEFVDFRDGKCWPNDRPGLGITLDRRSSIRWRNIQRRLEAIPTEGVTVRLRIGRSSIVDPRCWSLDVQTMDDGR